jgi:hypothetical protein
MTGHLPTLAQHGFPLPLLSTAEEDPCACESILKFEAKVEGLLQALTRKHILSQAVEGRSGEDWRSTGGQDAGVIPQRGLALGVA